jgi:hypothetical protein
MDRYLGGSPVNSANRAGGRQPTPAGSGQEMSMARVRNETNKERRWEDVVRKRSASSFLRVLSVVVAPVILVSPLILVGLTASAGNAATSPGPAAAAATSSFFGAKLTSQSEPSNAEDGQSCAENTGKPRGTTCTWVAISAFENGSHFTAPRTGTVKHVKLVSCKAGKFRLQLAKARPGAGKAKIVVNGPEISYHGQSPCGGSSGDHYIVQSIKVKLHVTKGDYIAIKAASTGTLSCSGGDGFLLYAPPLPLGGSYKKTKLGASCDLLVQLSYR